jgi:ribosome-associated heat shock protein Hsp15
MGSRPDQAPDAASPARVRLDKWLWAARFFKTRQLANEAIAGGKVHINGQRSKPGKEIAVGTVIEISKDQMTWQIVVEALSLRRGPAKVAVQLYRESDESLAKREAELIRRREEHELDVGIDGRPNKKDRRMIHRFKRTLA